MPRLLAAERRRQKVADEVTTARGATFPDSGTGLGRSESKTSRTKCINQPQSGQKCPKRSPERPNVYLSVLKASKSALNTFRDPGRDVLLYAGRAAFCHPVAGFPRTRALACAGRAAT